VLLLLQLLVLRLLLLPLLVPLFPSLWQLMSQVLTWSVRQAAPPCPRRGWWLLHAPVLLLWLWLWLCLQPLLLQNEAACPPWSTLADWWRTLQHQQQEQHGM
jgi:hypothetical protein